MMAKNTLSGVSFDPAKQSTPITQKAKKGQVKTHQGGYAFKAGDMERARRFLILGAESSFYQAGAQVAMENAKTVRKLAKSDKAIELVNLIVEISVGGRAAKQSPGLFALALVAAEAEDEKVKAYAWSKLGDVARTASALFEFVGYLAQFKHLGGTGFKKAIGRWYSEKSTDSLAYQMVKYRQRDGYDHARLLRLSKYVKSADDAKLSALLNWALGREYAIGDLPDIAYGFERAKEWEKTPNASSTQLASLVRAHKLSWEMIPTSALNEKKVWDALLDGNVPLGALIRQLPRLTNLDVVAQIGGRTAEIEDRLTNVEALRKARIHPLNLLVAQRTYASGRSVRGSSSWTPVRRIVDALEEAFYRSFDTIEPTGKRHYLALDVSGSMGWAKISESMPLTPREASAVMAMVTARTEREHYFGAFSHQMAEIDLSPRDTFQTAIRKVSSIPMGGTDLSLPMRDALAKKIPVDAFVVYTDSETGRGRLHPFQALQQYRDQMGIPAKLIVVAMTANKFTIADPDDGGMLDIAGFDTAAPGLIAEFVR